jgi:anti-sigma factor RsiW
MNDDRRMEPPQDPRQDPDRSGRPSRRTELLRAAADSELTAEQRAEFEAHLRACPADASVVAFEKALRGAIAETRIDGPSAELRARIEGMRGAAVRPVGLAVEDGQGLRFRLVRRRWTWLALAAGVALVAGVTYRMAFAPPPRPSGGVLVNPDHRSALVSFVTGQHDECELHAQLVGRRFRIGPLQAAPPALSKIIGAAPDLGQIEASGVRYLGAAECAVPGRGASVHIVLDAGALSESDGEGRTPLVSLFVQQDHGELNLEPGRTYRMVPREFGAGPAEIFVWRKGGLVYFLVSTSAEKLDAVRLGLGGAEPTGSI